MAHLSAAFNNMAERLQVGEEERLHVVEQLQQAQQRADQRAQEEEVLSRLGQVALQQLDMRQFLGQFLETLLTSVSWLALQQRGAIFLNRGNGEDGRTEVLFTTIHELGHIFNLWHVNDPGAS